MKQIVLVLLLCSLVACTDCGQKGAKAQVDNKADKAAQGKADSEAEAEAKSAFGADDIISILTDFVEAQDDEYEIPASVDRVWYTQNIKHVAEVSQKAINHLKAGDERAALDLLNNDLENFYAHPYADTYGTFVLTIAMDYLMRQCFGADSDTTITKEIEMYEFCLLRADAVQFTSTEYHPVFLDALNALYQLYRQKGDERKQAILDIICAYVDTHETKEVGMMLSKGLME